MTSEAASQGAQAGTGPAQDARGTTPSRVTPGAPEAERSKSTKIQSVSTVCNPNGLSSGEISTFFHIVSSMVGLISLRRGVC